MADSTKIEWTEATWNPTVGCSVISPGCTNCYAMKMADRIQRMSKQTHYAGTTKPSKAGPVWTGKLVQAPGDILLKPLRWKRPRMIFVNSMSDLFHENVPDEWIDKVFAVMALAPQHTFQVLTKRAQRMRAYLSENDMAARIAPVGARMMERGDAVFSELRWQQWPLANVWLGVSAEDQARADERIPHLLQAPAAVRFVSAEPLLGPIDVSRYCWPVCAYWPSPYRSPAEAKAAGATVEYKPQSLVSSSAVFLNWIIVGGESGGGARPMHPDWARSIRDQCHAAGVPFFFKQWGEWTHPTIGARGLTDGPEWGRPQVHRWDDGMHVGRVGKRAAGRLLDGREHNEMPERANG